LAIRGEKIEEKVKVIEEGWRRRRWVVRCGADDSERGGQLPWGKVAQDGCDVNKINSSKMGNWRM
jgi:hypothetical protein